MSGTDSEGGHIQMLNSIYDKLSRSDDKVKAWMWIARTRNYETGMPTISVRQLALKYGWSIGKSHKFIAEHFMNKSRTPDPHKQRADEETLNKSRTKVEHPDPETILLPNKQKTKLHNYPPPDWVDEEAWNGFVEMRKKIKKPLTERAMKLKINLLQKFKESGHDPNAILDKSTENSWTDLYEPKQRPGPIEINIEAINRVLEGKNGII